MSVENMASTERVCYLHCNFCNTILAVNVPSSSICTAFVTVRCGHCSNLLTVTMAAAASLQPLIPPHHHDLHDQPQKPHNNNSGSEEVITRGISGSSNSKGGSNKSTWSFASTEQEQPRNMLPPICPPEKRQRVPSAYNRFIKEEIQRIKASNPDISHREAFSTAAKNWAHFPHIHFGLKLDNNGSNKQAKLDHHHHNSLSSAASSTDLHHKSHAAAGGFY